MAYIYDLTDTWSAAGTVFNGIKLNVTNTASAAASKLITLQIGGTEHFSVTKAGVGYFSGNLGVGTSSPVSGGLLTVGSGSGSSTAVQYLNAGTGGSALIGRISSSPTWFMGDTVAALGSGSGLINFIYGANPWIVYLNNAERMRIDASGNVGIGTSSPTKKLSIETTPSAPTNGFNIQYSGSEVASFTSNAGTGEIRIGATGTGTYFPTFYSNNAERMRIDSSGGVGVGVVPAAVFSNRRTIQIGNQGSSITGFTGGGLTEIRNNTYLDTSGSEIYASTGSASRITLSNNETIFANAASGTSGAAASFSERMRIDSAGRVLIGTSATVGGTWSNEVKQTSSGVWPWGLNCVDRGLIVRNSSASSGFYAYFEYNGGTNNGSISWSGGTTAYNTTSDYRLKEIDGPITNSGAYIDALKPVEGWWKADGKRFIGFLAHQVQEVSQTSVVVGEKDGAEMQQMDYSAPELIANLIAEVQSLRARVAQLEGN